MLDLSQRQEIIELMHKEIVPAIGCTEPIAVALCVAKAREILGEIPEKIDVLLSKNIIKNAMGVGIPGTGMIGLPIAIALGATIGKSDYKLQVLKDLTQNDVENAKTYIDKGRINISLKENCPNNLYIEVHCYYKENQSIAIIQGAHDNFTYIEKNNKIIYKQDYRENKDNGSNVDLNFDQVYDFSIETPLEEIKFILDAAEMNKNASIISMDGDYGHQIKNILSSEKAKEIIGENILNTIIAATAGACDLRMDGAMVPVMSTAGSGNQGIAATLPVTLFAESFNCEKEQLIRALTLSNLMVIYIKQKLGKLSPLCGCVVASTGSSCGITYLLGGDKSQISFAAKNMIASITGMICDGAKPSCSLKIATSIYTAALSALMAIDNNVVSHHEGIIDDDIEKTIENLADIGKRGMRETDNVILEIMTNKNI
jgi:L-cysteine desulfidase